MIDRHDRPQMGNQLPVSLIGHHQLTPPPLTRLILSIMKRKQSLKNMTREKFFSPNSNTIAFLRSSECFLTETRPMSTIGPWFWDQSWKEMRLNLLDIRSGSVEEIGNRGENVTELAWNDTGTEIAFLTYPTQIWGQNNHEGGNRISLQQKTHNVRQIFHLPRKASNMVWCGRRLYLLANNILDQDTSGTAVYSMHVSTGLSTGRG
ncbi:hypothetical protein F5Y19DRAFT_143209 [Xylariaceae sp. FL1651]|nr:hypothetical protein F5Y19DRAFT_143209 [Xylariaceae sp. FL1651]